MKKAQVYCTLSEVIQDMNLQGDTNSLFGRILAASETIERELGVFIPTYEVKIFDGRSQDLIAIDPLLSVVSVLKDDEIFTDYTLLPRVSPWINGPIGLMLRLDYGYCFHGEIVITGTWGKYSELTEIGEKITLASATINTFTAQNGAKYQVGMVLKIEDEQVLITAGAGANGSEDGTMATSLLDGAILPEDEIIRVDAGSEFNPGEVICIDFEDLYIRRIYGNSLTVIRGWNETEIDAHGDNAPIAIYRTFTLDRGVNGTTASAHADIDAYRYRVPADINWLCRQIAGLMHKKAATGFEGRSGSVETGDSGYFSEFPPNQINKIRSHYSLRS